MLVLVGICVPVSGSVVLMPPPGPPVKVTLPCVCTDAAPGGVFTVASYLMVTLLPTFSTTGRLKEIVSPENGATGFEADAIEFAANGARFSFSPIGTKRGGSPTVREGAGSTPLLTRGLLPRSVDSSLLRRKFNVEVKAATGCSALRTHANVDGEALLPTFVCLATMSLSFCGGVMSAATLLSGGAIDPGVPQAAPPSKPNPPAPLSSEDWYVSVPLPIMLCPATKAFMAAKS